MLFMDEECFPFSLFYGADIQGWSRFELPFVAQTGVKSQSTLAIRGRVDGDAQDTIYFYGGTDGDTYTTGAEVVVETPFFTTNDPINTKQWLYLEMLAEGTWNVEIAVTYKGANNAPVWRQLAILENTTFMLNNTDIDEEGTAIALRLKSSSAKCKLSQIGINFNGDGDGQGGA
jgi:hypothetical protein